MKLIKTKIKNLLIVKTNIYKDHRGFFKEVEKSRILKKKFIFDCVSFSKKNTLRGLHLQKENSQAKLITVVHGKILDVVVDLRKKSKTYGKYFSIEMSHKSDFSLFILKVLPMVLCAYLKLVQFIINALITVIKKVK